MWASCMFQQIWPRYYCVFICYPFYRLCQFTHKLSFFIGSTVFAIDVNQNLPLVSVMNSTADIKSIHC